MKKSYFPRYRGGFFSNAVKLAVVLSVFLTWQACNEPDEIGLDLIDEQADFSPLDTVTIQAYTIPDDSLPTNLSAQNLLGLMHDPVFGKTKASIYTEIRLPENDFSLGETPILDSVRLSLAYTGRYYGNLETPQTVKVYELSENFPENDTLYSTSTLEYYPDPIGTRELLPMPQDSIIVDTITTLPPHFIVPLSQEFGQKIIDANGTEYFENIPNFLEYFKGLYITVEEDISEGGAIFNLNMASTYTRLQLYYRNSPEDTVSRVQNFRVTEFAKRVTHVETFGYEQAHPLLQEQVLDSLTESGDSLVFLQALGSLRANIDLPFLGDLPSDIAINRARLIIPVDEQFVDEELYPAAERLLLFRYDEEGEIAQLSDMEIGSSYFGGAYDEEKGQYVFNIASHIQQVITGEIENTGLTLVISGAGENARRVVLKGPGRSENNMRLEIIYTEFE